MGSWSRPYILLLLLLAALAASPPPAAPQAQEHVVVTVYGDPAACLTKVAAFSNTRNVPVPLSKTGEATWVSEPVPRGELITIAYERVPECSNYVAVNEQTLDKIYNADRIALYATYNATIAIKATAYTSVTTTTKPVEPAPTSALSAALQQVIQYVPAVVPYAFTIAAAYAGFYALRKYTQLSRKRRREQETLKRCITSLKQSSKNMLIKRGWLWMDIDPAYEVLHGTDPDRKIAAFLKLARVLPAGRDRMEKLFRETMDRAYAPAIIGHGAGHAAIDPGEDLVWYAVELAQDDPEIDRAFTRIGKAGADPYAIPRELAGLDEIIKTYRGRPMEDLGFRYVGGEVAETCPLCGRKTVKGSKYCTYCGGEIKKTGKRPEAAPKPVRLEKQELARCPACRNPITPGAQYCSECGHILSQSITPSAAPDVRQLKPQKQDAQMPPAREEMRPAEACPNCGAKLLRRAKYCTRCGANLSATATKAADSTMKELVARSREAVTETPAPEKRVTAEPAVHAESVAPPQPKPDQRKAVEEGGVKERPPAYREVKTVEETIKPPPEKPAAEEVAKTWSAEAVETVKQTPARPAQPPSPPGPEAVRVGEAPTPPAPPESQEEPTEVEWEPDRDSLELLKNMEIPVEDFRREAFRLARLARIGEEDRAFERELMRSANRLASLVEGLDENFKVQLMMSLSQHLRDAAFVVRKELRPPKPQKPEAGKPLDKAPPEPAEVAEPPKPKPERAPEITQPPRPVEPTKPPRPIEEAKAAESPKPPAKPDKEKPLTEIDYGVLLDEGAEAGHVYILDLPRSAVPTAMVTKVRNTVNVEVSTGAGPDSVLALTRTTYRANYKSMVRPSPNHPYVRRLEKLVSSGAGGGVMTTAEIYEMLNGVFAARGFKPVMVRLDTGRIAERLKQAGGEQVAGRLAKLFALMPEALDMFLSGGVEGLRKHFQNLLGQEDGEELFQAVRAVVSGDLRYVNKPLMVGLGMLDEAG